MICYDWVSLYIYQCVTLFTVVLHGGSWVPLECSCLSKCISVFIKKLLVHFYHSVSLRKNSLVRSSLPNNTNYDFLQLLTIPNSSNFNYRFIPENIMLIHTQTVGNSVAFLAHIYKSLKLQLYVARLQWRCYSTVVISLVVTRAKK